MPVGINFGSATSGAGFDVTSTVNSIMALERTPETAWATRTTALQAQDTALTTLGTNVSALSTALQALTSFDGVFAQKQGASANTAAVALRSVGVTAQTGTHTLTVQRLATTAQQFSSAVTARAVLSGTLTVQTASASSATTISIDPGSSLADVALRINGSGAGVRATLLSDVNGQHLSLASLNSGAAGDVTIQSSVEDSNGNTLGFTVARTGSDAAYTLDGVALTNASNTVSTALQGVSFQLAGVSSVGIEVQIAPDQDAIVSALQTFVSAYNTMSASLTAQEGKDASGNAQPLYGSTVVSELQSRLSSALALAPGSSGTGLPLASLGLSLSLTGTLSLDSATLGTTLASNFDQISDSFMASESLGQNLAATLTGLGSTGTGTLALALQNNSSEETALANNKTALEARLSAYQTRLTAELNTANQILQAIPQQLNEVNQIFYSISGYRNS